MTYFTDNPLERLMQQKPIPEIRKGSSDSLMGMAAPDEPSEHVPLSPDAVQLLIDRLRRLPLSLPLTC